MSKHTPGPWIVQQLNHSRSELWLQIGYEKSNGTQWGPVCRVNSPAEPMPDGVVAEIKYMATGNENQWANARLIAAAPHLLAACRMVVDDENLTQSANEVLRDAIARATAETTSAH